MSVVARRRDVVFPDGSRAHVDLVRSDREPAEGAVFAAMVVVQDREGRYAVEYSPRRQEWGVPGGGREPGESVRACAVREVWEETGLRVGEQSLKPWGYEVFEALGEGGRWPPGGGVLQVYRTRIEESAPALRVMDGELGHDPQWVTQEELRRRCQVSFWWPLVAPLVRPAVPD